MKVLKTTDVFVLGNFGSFSNALDGQITKTREIHNLFSQNLEKKVSFFDIDKVKKPGLHILNILIHLARAKVLVYLPGLNNLKLLFPFLYLLSKLYHFEIHYFVIGGWLPGFLEIHPGYEARLRKVDCIYVETDEMVKKLTYTHNLSNVIWFPNFRVDYQTRRKESQSKILRMVFMSRITLLKGVDTVFGLLDYMNKLPLSKFVSIDFYGPIDSNIEDWFLSQISIHKNSKYCGMASPEEVQLILCNYDLMLFPTRYPGEGCPGVIIEAYMASVPVLASKWKYNNEFVKEGITGYLFDPNDLPKLTDIITALVNERRLVSELGKNAKAFSKDFTQYNAWQIIMKTMNLE